MIYKFDLSLKDYAAQGKDIPLIHIARCANCHREKNVIGYGFYSRWCNQSIIWIRRYFCKFCCTTFSLLPSFLCVGIGEALEVVEGLLWYRSQGKSYRESKEAIGRPEFSYQRLQYWGRRWRKKIAILRTALPLKEMNKTLSIFEHLSTFFHHPQDSKRLFEATNGYFSLHFYKALL